MPPHVYGIGLNYRKHALETGLPIPRHPIVFSKPTSSVCAHGADIRVPLCCQGDAHAVKGSGGESSDISMESTMSEEEPVMEVDYEAELAVIIGCRVMPTTSSKSGSGTAASVAYCKDVSPKEALDFVVGYTGANDVTARRWQGAKRGGGQWDYAKSFDTFCPLGPAIVRGTCTSTDSGMDAGSAPHFPIACRLQRNHLKKDGVQTMQQSSTADLIFPIAHLISFLSQGRTLLPGTVILTGTPEGVGFARRPPVFLGHGDVVEVEVGGGIGVLRNRVWFEGRRA